MRKCRIWIPFYILSFIHLNIIGLEMATLALFPFLPGESYKKSILQYRKVIDKDNQFPAEKWLI